MPRGVYDRSKSRKKSKRKAQVKGRAAKVKAAKTKTKSKAKAAKPAAPKVIAVLRTNEAVMAFKAQASSFHRQSLVLACSAAVCLIVAAHANGDSVAPDVMVERLKKEVAGRGNLKTAQVHKYVGVARALVSHLTQQFKLRGPVHDVLVAKTPDVANRALIEYLEEHKVTNLEGLTNMFGRYRRAKTKTRAPEPAPAPAPAGKNGKGTNGGKPVRVGEGPTIQAAANNEREGLKVVLTSLPADFIMLTAVQGGHQPVDLGVASINLVTTESDCAHLREVLDSRERHITESIPLTARKAPQVGQASRRKLAAAA